MNAADAAPPAAPRPEHRCPLCGGPNACAVAARGDYGAACWCHDVVFPPSRLTAVPENARGPACLCRSCAERGQPPDHRATA